MHNVGVAQQAAYDLWQLRKVGMPRAQRAQLVGS
jgi:hypothetical protein